MVYRHVGYPKVRLNIAAIVIATHLEATPYIAKNMLNDGAFESYKALDDSIKFHFDLRNTAPFDKCDLVAIMTRYKMGTKEEPNSIQGLAYVDVLCRQYEDEGKKWGALLINDPGAFTGIVGAAHELGHLFGMHHDPEAPSVGCGTGYVMGAVPPAAYASWLSRCSLEALKTSYESGKYECMYDAPPAVGRELPRLMPGKMDDLTKQCKTLGYGPPYHPEDGSVDVCVEIHCYSTDDSGYNFGTGMAAAPGTPCGRKTDSEAKVCLKSRCVRVTSASRK